MPAPVLEHVPNYSKAIALDQYSGQPTSDAANYDPRYNRLWCQHLLLHCSSSS